MPNGLALESHLGDRLYFLVGGDVKELFVTFFADFDAVAATLKLIAKSPDEFSLRVEDEDRGMVLLIFAAFVNHVQVIGLIDRTLWVVCQVYWLGS